MDEWESLECAYVSSEVAEFIYEDCLHEIGSALIKLEITIRAKREDLSKEKPSPSHRSKARHRMENISAVLLEPLEPNPRYTIFQHASPSSKFDQENG